MTDRISGVMSSRPLKVLAPVLFGLAMLIAVAGRSFAATELQFWFGVSGANAEVIKGLATEFNAGQAEYRVVPVFKGTYPETLQAGIDAFAAGNPPHIIQVFDVGTGVMMNSEGAFIPVAEVMEKGGGKFDKDQYLPGIVAYYSRPDGTMLSFPFNSSSPILFYNRDAYRRAGLEVDNPPKTWPEVWSAARRIVSSGAATCGYTSPWLTWIHVENFAAWNNLPYATNQNGMASADIELKFNAPIFVKHFQEIADLAAEGVFRYGGRTSEAKQLFLSGECAILTDSSAAYGDAQKSGIDYGTGPLPYDPDAPDAPQNTIPGGASLWVFAGHTDNEYRGVAKFFEFLSQTGVQSQLHQVSGYLPVTMAAYEATRASGFYEENPGREQPILQMTGKIPTDNSRGVRAINLPELREIQNEEFEAMLAGAENAQQALDNAVRRGNAAVKAALARLP
jgi:sn-glycerol 3-phosphate transport system substrate-binding protein